MSMKFNNIFNSVTIWQSRSEIYEFDVWQVSCCSGTASGTPCPSESGLRFMTSLDVTSHRIWPQIRNVSMTSQLPQKWSRRVERRVDGTVGRTSLRIRPPILDVPVEEPQPCWFTLVGDGLWPRRGAGSSHQVVLWTCPGRQDVLAGRRILAPSAADVLRKSVHVVGPGVVFLVLGHSPRGVRYKAVFHLVTNPYVLPGAVFHPRVKPSSPIKTVVKNDWLLAKIRRSN